MEIKYRTESFSGAEIRDVTDIICYEVSELGNTDILETLSQGLLKETPCGKKAENLIECVALNGTAPDIQVREFCAEMLQVIKEKTGKTIQYALWLASKEDVLNNFWRWANGAYQDNDPCPDPEPWDIDAYEIGPVILSEGDGDGGTLYGYEQYPVPIDPKQWFFSFLKDRT